MGDLMFTLTLESYVLLNESSYIVMQQWHTIYQRNYVTMNQQNLIILEHWPSHIKWNEMNNLRDLISLSVWWTNAVRDRWWMSLVPRSWSAWPGGRGRWCTCTVPPFRKKIKPGSRKTPRVLLRWRWLDYLPPW